MKVEDVMTRGVHTCDRRHTLNAAAQIMWEHDIGALPVIDAAGEPIAMITDRDICMAAFTQGQPLAQLLVESAMSRALHTCRRDELLSAAEKTMQLHQVRRLPVVDDLGRIAGMLSLNDIARARMRTPLGRATERLVGDLTATLAAISAPRLPATDPSASRAARPERGAEPFPVGRDPSTNPQQPRIRPPRLADALSYFKS